jgi:hypothetical protein
MSNEQKQQRQGAPSPDAHPLIDGWRAWYGDEAELYTCDECGRPFLAEEACYSKWNGAPICPRCARIQQAE